MVNKLNLFDKKIISWMKKHGLNILRYSLAIIFIWFGILKPFGISSANSLVANTVYWVSPSWFIPLLGWWEVAIGICLLHKKLIRLGLFLMFFQMIGTFLPFFILPEVVFGKNIFDLTLEGQYIMKNIVLIAAAIVIGSHIRDKESK